MAAYIRTSFILIFFAFFLAVYTPATTFAQTINKSTYPVTMNAGVKLMNMAGADTIITGGVDSIPSYSYNFADSFIFYFAGKPYKSFCASPDGWLRLGINGSKPAKTDFTDSANTPIIAPYWSVDGKTADVGAVCYKVSGTAPKRIAIIQWELNIGIFQVWLHEGSGKIDFVYDSIAPLAQRINIGFCANIAGKPQFCSVNADFYSGYLYVGYIDPTMNFYLQIPSGSSLAFTPDSIAPKAPENFTAEEIYATTLKLSWIDSSVKESHYNILISEDGVKYKDLITYESTTQLSKGDQYSYIVKYLKPATKYFFKIESATDCGIPSQPVFFTATTLPTSLKGLKQIPGNYNSITAALEDIRKNGLAGPVILELNDNYSAKNETFPIVFDSCLRTNNIKTLTLRPAKGSDNIYINGNEKNNIILFNNADGITIDGRPGGIGEQRSLIIANDSVVGGAISFINGSSNDTIRHCIMQASTKTGNKTVVYFGNGLAGKGNSKNALEFCEIKDGINGTPERAIFSSGTPDAQNTDNLILSNNIYNYYHNSSTYNPCGIYIIDGNDNWIIKGNSFYQTEHRVLSNYIYAINIEKADGGHFIITNNYIGGQSPFCKGPKSYFLGNQLGTVYHGIYVSLKNKGKCYVTGNTVTNLNVRTAYLIAAASAETEVSHNKIGDDDTTISIVTRDYCAGISAGGYPKIILQNNTISGITAGTNKTSEGGFLAINSGGEYITIANNIIGSATQKNSIVQHGSSGIYGIQFYLNYGVNTRNVNISKNIIANLTVNNESGYSNSNVIAGIYTSGSTVSSVKINIDSNSVFNFTTNSRSSIPLAGIISTYDIGNSVFTITNNKIHSFSSTFQGEEINYSEHGVYGMKIVSIEENRKHIISNNFIHSLSIASQGSHTKVCGIQTNLMGMKCFNNVIKLGLDASGKPTSNQEIFGLDISSKGRNSIFNNTIYLTGSYAKCYGQSFPLYYGYNYTDSNNSDTLVNNIIVCDRVSLDSMCKISEPLYISYNNYNSYNNKGVRKPYIDYNLYYSPAGYAIAGKPAAFNEWQRISEYDINSIFADPHFNISTGVTKISDMSFKDSTPCEGAGKYIPWLTTDYFNNSRDALSATDIGAIAGNFKRIKEDIYAPDIKITDTLTHTGDINNRIINNIRITDIGAGIPTSGDKVPRIWYRRKAPKASPWANTAGKIISGDGHDGIWEFTIDYNSAGVKVSINDELEYYIVAQDLSANKNIGYLYGRNGTHSSVDTQITAPKTGYTYRILNPLNGIVEVGLNKKYTTLTGKGGFFEDANSSVLTGDLIVKITSKLTEPGTFELHKVPQASNGNEYTITIQPDMPNERIIEGSAENLIRLVGAQHVIINGQYNNAGRYLRFRNKNTNTSTLYLSNAAFIEISNTVIEASEYGEGIKLKSDVFEPGNKNILITNNYFRDRSDANSLPAFHIVAGKKYEYPTLNNYIEILNNEFSNYVISAIFIDTFNNGNYWKINNNSFYHTKPLWVKDDHIPIRFLPKSSVGNEIIGNYIGGTKAFCGGTAYVNIPFFADSDIFFTGISLRVAASGTTIVKDNIIRNIRLLNKEALQPGTAYIPVGTFNGIHIIDGNVNIINNIIGGDSDTGSIHVRFAERGLHEKICGILNESNDTVNIENCKIGSISTSSGTLVNSNGFGEILGIVNLNGIVKIKNNLIGSQATKNSIVGRAINNTENRIGQSIFGIYTSSNGHTEISDNEIANLVNNSTLHNTDQIAGIVCQGKVSVINNSIHNIYTNTSREYYGKKASAIGISISDTAFSDTAYIIGNQIFALESISAADKMQLVGIEVKNTNGNYQHISMNYIHSFALNGADSSSGITGIANISGQSLITNNMVRLGFDEAGNTIQAPIDITGIKQVSPNHNKIIYNSIYIGGDSISGINNTAALSHKRGNKDTVCNNILYNARSNRNATIAKHHLILIEDYANVHLNSNLYFIDGLGGNTGVLNGISAATIYNKKFARKIDDNAVLYNPAFKNPKGNKLNGSLHIKDTSIIEAAGKLSFNIPADFDNDLRQELSPVDIGVDAGNYILPDTSAPLINYTPITKQYTKDSAYIIASVTDFYGIPLKGNNVPKLFFKMGIYGKYEVVNGIKLQGDSLNSMWKFYFEKKVLSSLRYNDTVYYFIAAENLRSVKRVASNPAKNFEASSLHNIVSYPVNPNYFLIGNTVKQEIKCISTKATFTGDGTCINENLHIELLHKGGSSWFWTFGDGSTSTLENPGHKYSATGTYMVKLVVKNNYGCTDSFSKLIKVDSICVWPGDANADKVVDNKDILAIGVAYASTGTARTDTSTFWKPNVVENWTGKFISGHNFKHADCNGNGVINDLDTSAVTRNYTRTHQKNSDENRGKKTDPEFRLNIGNDSLKAGDTLVAYITLGENALPAINIYGLAFNLEYNEANFTGNPIIDYSKTWLDNDGSKLLIYENFANGKDFAVTRTNHKNISGFGNIATIKLAVNKDLNPDTKEIKLGINYDLIISANETRIPVNVVNDSVKTHNTSTSIGSYNSLKSNINVYPNPFKQDVVVEYNLKGESAVQFSILSINGSIKQVYPKVNKQAGNHQFILNSETNKLNKGVYILLIEIDAVPYYFPIIKIE